MFLFAYRLAGKKPGIVPVRIAQSKASATAAAAQVDDPVCMPEHSRLVSVEVLQVCGESWQKFLPTSINIPHDGYELIAMPCGRYLHSSRIATFGRNADKDDRVA